MTDGRRSAKTFGRRPYADKRAREMLNDISRWVARTRPDDIDDPDDPSLSDLIRHAPRALNGSYPDLKRETLAGLLDQGLTFEESVTWYFYRACDLTVRDIYVLCAGGSMGERAQARHDAIRAVQRALTGAASKLDGEDPDSIPNLLNGDSDA